jgi:hypothetical protein
MKMRRCVEMTGKGGKKVLFHTLSSVTLFKEASPLHLEERSKPI